jgi:hypothetical protein
VDLLQYGGETLKIGHHDHHIHRKSPTTKKLKTKNIKSKIRKSLVILGSMDYFVGENLTETIDFPMKSEGFRKNLPCCHATKVAFLAGSSQQGKHFRASMASNWVVAMKRFTPLESVYCER